MNYSKKDIPVLFEADCCVCGGGTAGVPAAVMAARGGSGTIIVEKGVSVGGAQTRALVLPFMPTFVEGSDTPIITEIKKRMLDEGIDMDDKVTAFGWFNPEKIAYIYDKMLQEAGVKILYNADLIDAVTEDKKIRYVIVNTIEGLVAIKAGVFIDCTGDAVLARISGVKTEKGFEKTGNNQPMSFRFEMGGIDLDRLYEYTRSINDNWCATKPPYFEIALARHRDIKYPLEPLFVAGFERGELTEEDIEYFQAFTITGKPGCMSMNCPEIPVKFKATRAADLSDAIVYARSMIHRISKFVIKNIPGFEKAYISREASMIGARESFRIVGKYQMTENDYHERRKFDDAVAKTAWYIDAHGEKVGEYLAKGEYYEIPYRALITNEIDNLIVAGRCISATFILQASMRIQPTCMSLGEAAGAAAAYSKKRGIAVNAIEWDKVENDIKAYKK
ncbi:MAG TPA: FAD-dependent oxidoreductase [Candidatus Wallbacteria bacterium]|nr:FAD-dependent oxidoreductase [Candidatus Wallbacteria bacterium]